MRAPILPQAPWSAMRTALEVFFTVKIREVRDDLALTMDGLQCPGEPYTISRLICRGRQAKGYVKCPACPNREASAEVIQVQPPEPVAFQPVPAAPARIQARARIPAAAYRMPAQPETGLMALARRLYDYF